MVHAGSLLYTTVGVWVDAGVDISSDSPTPICRNQHPTVYGWAF